MWRKYVCPKTVEEALAILGEQGGRARLIAGGTDLALQLRRGEWHADCLVDISVLEELQQITEGDGFVIVGSAVTHAQLASSALIRQRAPLLAQAAAEVGSPEIRQVATVGGNVVNAQPAADTALALLALDAEAETTSASGTTWVPLCNLYTGAGRSAVDSTSELVRGFRFPLPSERSGSAYRRLGKCKSIALPVLCAAALVVLRADRFSRASLAIGPVAPRPFRASGAEAWLVGQPATGETISQAAQMARQATHPRDSILRCAAAYREEMVSALVASTLQQAVAAAEMPRGMRL